MPTFEYDLSVLPPGNGYPIYRLMHGTVTVERPSEEMANEKVFAMIEDKYGYSRNGVDRLDLELLDDEDSGTGREF